MSSPGGAGPTHDEAERLDPPVAHALPAVIAHRQGALVEHRLRRDGAGFKIAHKRVTMATALGHGLWSFVKHYIFKLSLIRN